MEFLIDHWDFLRIRKKYWMIPLLIMVIILLLNVLSSGFAIAPFIYTIY